MTTTGRGEHDTETRAGEAEAVRARRSDLFDAVARHCAGASYPNAAVDAFAAAVRAETVEACEAALTKDADPSVWWFVGEAINRIRAAAARLAREAQS